MFLINIRGVDKVILRKKIKCIVKIAKKVNEKSRKAKGDCT